MLALAMIAGAILSGQGYDIPPQKALVVMRPRVLVFSKTAGFRHDSIPVGITTIQEIGKERGLTVEATEDAAIFAQKLNEADVVVFLCTTGDVLNDDQQKAMEAFVEGGGGYVGIHAASDTEYEWPWYGKLVGAYFARHPQIQEAQLTLEDRAHPTTAFLPKVFKRTDEWYDFKANPRSKVRTLVSLDPKSYQGSEMKDDHPITWCQEIGKGRAWYTGFGHTKETYAEPAFRQMLAEAIVWTAQGKTPDNAKPISFSDQDGWKSENGELACNGSAKNILSKESFGDGHYHLEFKIPAHSNSGVYVQGRYEVQIRDDFGKPDDQLDYGSGGGIYHGIAEKQDGFKPLRNALRAPGEWNAYDILFRAPRFDGSGKKIQDAYFVEIRLNGVLIHEKVQIGGPTLAPLDPKEVAGGPIMLQGDHGPVTYRNMWHRYVVLDWVK